MLAKHRSLSNRFLTITCAALLVSFASSSFAFVRDPFAKVAPEQREPLKKRLNDYIKLQRTHDWSNLYDLVSDAGRGGVSREKFIEAMGRGHGRDFANEPDLLQFTPGRTEDGLPNGFDILGCAEAVREGESYRGVAIIHAVFEHDNWFFTGWTFTDISDHGCKSLDDPAWTPPAPMKWTIPMEELR